MVPAASGCLFIFLAHRLSFSAALPTVDRFISAGTACGQSSTCSICARRAAWPPNAAPFTIFHPSGDCSWANATCAQRVQLSPSGRRLDSFLPRMANYETYKCANCPRSSGLSLKKRLHKSRTKTCASSGTSRLSFPTKQADRSS